MSSQQLPERRPKKIDLDLLPREYKPPKLSKLRMGLVAATIVLACLLVTFITFKMDSDSQIGPLEDKLAVLEVELQGLYAIKAEADALQKQIDAKENTFNKMEQDYQTFLQGVVLWSEIIEEIDDILPGRRITLTSITQSDSKVQLSGSADEKEYVGDYRLDLEESDYFSSATIKSVSCPVGEQCTFTINLQLSGAGGT